MARDAIAQALRQQAEAYADNLRVQQRANEDAVAVLKLYMESRVVVSQRAFAILIHTHQARDSEGNRRAGAQEHMLRQLHSLVHNK